MQEVSEAGLCIILGLAQLQESVPQAHLQEVRWRLRQQAQQR